VALQHPRAARPTQRPTLPNQPSFAAVKAGEGNKGSPAVFLSEQTNAIYKVLDHPGVRADVGYRVEVAAAVDEKAKTVSIRSVKRLSEVTAMCLLPKKRGGN